MKISIYGRGSIACSKTLLYIKDRALFEKIRFVLNEKHPKAFFGGGYEPTKEEIEDALNAMSVMYAIMTEQDFFEKEPEPPVS